MKTPISLFVLLASAFAGMAADLTKPLAPPDLVFEEADGVAAIEAEHFYKQTLTDKRAWYLTTSQSTPELKPDSDSAHVGGASGGAYLEILPDSRATDQQKLIQGENFTDKAGLMTVLHYKVQINTPGPYYVWGRVFSTGPEDNGMHVGLDGQWPASGQRWQTVQKQQWAWDCKQRTAEVHTGVPMQLFLDIEKSGEHEIMISMREDDFELDKFILASSKEFKPEGQGPAPKVKSGKAPTVFAEVPGSGGIPAAGNSENKTDGRLEARPSNPFTDLAFNVTFTHESGAPKYTVPGYFAADGDAARISADSTARVTLAVVCRWSR